MATALAPPETARPDTRPAGGGGWAATVGAVGGIFLGGVFLVATWGKVLDPIAFAEVIELEGLDWLVPAAAMAPFILALEAFFGFALVFNLRRLWVMIPLSGLVLFFVFLTARAYVRDLQGIKPETASCGCFGNLLDRTPAEAFWQDLLLLVPPLVLSFFGRPRGRPVIPLVRTAVVVLLTLGVLVFAFQAPHLPLDDLATKLKPGVRIKEVCAGGGDDRICLDSPALAAMLSEGKHLVLLADLKDEAFANSIAERLDELIEAERPLAPDSGPVLRFEGRCSRVQLSEFGPTVRLSGRPFGTSASALPHPSTLVPGGGWRGRSDLRGVPPAERGRTVGRPICSWGFVMKLASLLGRSVLVFLPLLFLTLTVGVRGVGADAHPTLRDFQRTGQYMLYVDGKPIPDARIYRSTQAFAYLVVAEPFDVAVLVLQRKRCVEGVTPEEMAERTDGGVDVKKDVVPCSLGSFRIEGPDVAFKVGDLQARLRPKPPLEGRHPAAELVQHTPEYARAAKAYKPDPATMRVLKGTSKKAKVVLFFGSWCTFCNRFLPNAMRVEEEMKDTTVEFEYVGLPPPPAAWVSEDASQNNVKKLITGLIYIDGREVGRLVGEPWIRPERSLLPYLR